MAHKYHSFGPNHHSNEYEAYIMLATTTHTNIQSEKRGSRDRRTVLHCMLRLALASAQLHTLRTKAGQHFMLNTERRREPSCIF